MTKRFSIYFILALLTLFACQDAFASQEQNKLAILIGSDWGLDVASHNDVQSMNKALRRRGFTSEEIVVLEGNLSRSMVISLLAHTRRRTATWKQGTIFLYYSGHGTYQRISKADVEPGLSLNRNLLDSEQKLLWREVFATLRTPMRVKLILLPDSWHTNLLADRVPANVIAIIMDSPKDELSCKAFSENFKQGGEEVSRGVISYYATRTLADARDVNDWLQKISAETRTDVEHKTLSSIRKPKLRAIGRADVVLPGKRVL